MGSASHQKHAMPAPPTGCLQQPAALRSSSAPTMHDIKQLPAHKYLFTSITPTNTVRHTCGTTISLSVCACEPSGPTQPQLQHCLLHSHSYATKPLLSYTLHCQVLITMHHHLGLAYSSAAASSISSTAITPAGPVAAALFLGCFDAADGSSRLSVTTGM